MRYLWVSVYFGIGTALILCSAFSHPCPIIQLTGSNAQSVYETSCKTCHGPAGPASILEPGTLSKEEWEEFFRRGLHLGENLEEIVSSQEIEVIMRYCLANAAPSDR